MTHQRHDYQYEANSYVENKHASLNIPTWELMLLCAGYLDGKTLWQATTEMNPQ